MAAAFLFAASAMTVQANAQQIITFDAPGADTKPGDYNGTFASAINNWGAITGSFVDTNNVYRGFLRSAKGSFITFDAPGADTTAGSFNGTSPNSINDLGMITGEYLDANGFGHGFLRSREGKLTTFDVPGAGGYGTTPIAVNLEGAIVGYYTDSNYLFHAFLRRPMARLRHGLVQARATPTGRKGVTARELPTSMHLEQLRAAGKTTPATSFTMTSCAVPTES
jgi:hypothetical protein